MESEDSHILDTVISVVTRYGMKRTTMNELAQHAGVSRQTLYDKYGDKDGIMAAAIKWVAVKQLATLQIALNDASELSAKIDAYFDIIVWPTFHAMQSMPDAADFERGLGPASVAQTERVGEEKRAILASMLADHVTSIGPTAHDIASFFEQSSSRAKTSIHSHEDLAGFLAVLKSSVLALAAKPS